MGKLQRRATFYSQLEWKNLTREQPEDNEDILLLDEDGQVHFGWMYNLPKNTIECHCCEGVMSLPRFIFWARIELPDLELPI